MIEEDKLRALLAEAADAIPPPGRAPEALLESLTERKSAPRSRRRLPPARVLAIAAGVLVVLALGVTLLGGRDSNKKFTNVGARIGNGNASGSPGVGESSSATTIAVALPATPAREVAGSGTSGAGGGATAGAGTGPSPAPASVAAPTADTAKVIKTGSLQLEVRKGTFEGTVDVITAKTIGLGGYVAESTTNEAESSPSGSITIRVPAASFDQLLTDLRKLGKVTSVTSKGTDVTAQFTDLAARLSALGATRERLLSVLAGARNVGDIIAVQDRITGVQTEIEQIQGQQRLLQDQTAFGTLAVTLGEPGAEVRIASEPGGLGKAWDDARHRFGNGIEGIVAWSGSAAVVLLVGLLLLVPGRFAWVLLRRRMV